jgi:hypothetical protein
VSDDDPRTDELVRRFEIIDRALGGDVDALDQVTLVGLTTAEVDAVASGMELRSDLEHDRMDRVMPLFEFAAPYSRAGARSWREVADMALDDGAGERFLELFERLQPGDLRE